MNINSIPNQIITGLIASAFFAYCITGAAAFLVAIVSLLGGAG